MSVETDLVVSTVPTVEDSTAYKLQEVVSSWYFILRNLALLVLMLLLIYSGIRIVIGSTAGEKAKYKERLMDWLVAMCLVFIMHYIMAFAVEIVENITTLVSGVYAQNVNADYIPLTTEQNNNVNVLNDAGVWDTFGGLDGENGIRVDDASAGSGKALRWTTNLMGEFRIQSQLVNKGTAEWVGYSLCYLVLVMYTCFFAFTYIKRVIYMAFLTMIAPLVAMTYPIDKITDGKAQAFDAWLKEYIFNLMIQPLHLLLYTVLVTSAYHLVSENPIYALVAIGFMTPAEKLMRRFFGFEKAKTPGLLGGAAGAAIAMTGLQNILKPRHRGGKTGGNSGGNAKDPNSNKVKKYSNKSKINEMDEIYDSSKPEENIRQNKNQEDGHNEDDMRENASGEDIRQNRSQENGHNEDDMRENANDALPIDFLSEAAPMEAAPSQKPQASAKGDNRVNNKGRKSNVGRIIGATGKATLASGGKVAGGVLKGAGKLALAATGATAGLVLGVASGDPNKAFQYTTAGALAGNAVLGPMPRAKDMVSKYPIDDIQRKADPANYKKRMVEQQKKQFIKEKENIYYLGETLEVDYSTAKDILEETGSNCYDNGITDIEDIAAIYKLTSGADGKGAMKFEKAVAARAYAKKKLGGADLEQMTPDKAKKYKDKWANEFKDKYKNLNNEQAMDLANKAFDSAIRFNKAKSSLTKI